MVLVYDEHLDSVNRNSMYEMTKMNNGLSLVYGVSFQGFSVSLMI